MALNYDENVIVTFAERLYRRAATIVIFYALLGGVIGALIAEVFSRGARVSSDASSGYAVLLGIVGMIIGGIIGNERAFALRLMAQQALCQVQIERNTRGTAVAAGWAHSSQVGVPAQTAIPMPPVSR